MTDSKRMKTLHYPHARREPASAAADEVVDSAGVRLQAKALCVSSKLRLAQTTGAMRVHM